jgi:hypothetical protein
MERTLRAKKFPTDVQGLASYNHDLLAVEQLLRNSACQATEEVTLAVNGDLFPNEPSAKLFPSHVVDGASRTAWSATYDWLEGRHFVLSPAEREDECRCVCRNPLPSKLVEELSCLSLMIFLEGVLNANDILNLLATVIIVFI